MVLAVGVLTAGLTGWSGDQYRGAAVGLITGTVIAAARLHRRPLWSWPILWARRNRAIVLSEPVTVVNDRAGGGVRCQDGIATVAVQVLGRAHTGTLVTGSTSTSTDNVLDIAGLVPLLHQSLGLTIGSLSVISAGARRRNTGDYPRVYDTLIGTPPYAGRRETWLIMRVSAWANIEALRWRSSAEVATLAAAQRICAALRQRGIRAKVATAADIVEMEQRLGVAALSPARRRWRSVRGETGWLTTYGYRRQDITTAKLAQAWSMRVDGVVQNVTIFDDATTTATVTVRTPMPPVAPPSVLLQTLPGQQAPAIAANLCGPLLRLGGVGAGVLTGPLVIPIGPSGVLLGRVGSGDRLMLPLDDPGEATRVHIAADDHLAKRIVVRLAATGEKITVHTHDRRRWDSVRMPDVVVSDSARPAGGTTVSITDGTVVPAPRPNTVISVADRATTGGVTADVLITQTGPAALEVSTAGRLHTVEVDLFRVENRYLSAETITSERAAELEPVD
jgi:type VII secretion protein EccE